MGAQRRVSAVLGLSLVLLTGTSTVLPTGAQVGKSQETPTTIWTDGLILAPPPPRGAPGP